MISFLLFLCKGVKEITRANEQQMASGFDPCPQGIPESLYRNTGDLLRQYTEAVQFRDIVLSFGKDLGKGDMVVLGIPLYGGKIPGADAEF